MAMLFFEKLSINYASDFCTTPRCGYSQFMCDLILRCMEVVAKAGEHGKLTANWKAHKRLLHKSAPKHIDWRPSTVPSSHGPGIAVT